MPAGIVAHLLKQKDPLLVKDPPVELAHFALKRLFSRGQLGSPLHVIGDLGLPQILNGDRTQSEEGKGRPDSVGIHTRRVVERVAEAGGLSVELLPREVHPYLGRDSTPICLRGLKDLRRRGKAQGFAGKLGNCHALAQIKVLRHLRGQIEVQDLLEFGD